MLYPERVGVFVYLYYNRDARKLNKFGDFRYQSKRFRYVQLYVPADGLEETLSQLKAQKFVKRVEPSYLAQVDQDFVGSLTRQDQVDQPNTPC